MKLNDITRVSPVWKEEKTTTQNPGDTRRNLLKTLEEKYVIPMRSKRKDKIITSMSYEAKRFCGTLRFSLRRDLKGQQD